MEKYDFICPITQEYFNEPVIIDSGIRFEKKAIKKWLLNHNICPVTGIKLKHTNYCKDFHFEKLLKQFKIENNIENNFDINNVFIDQEYSLLKKHNINNITFNISEFKHNYIETFFKNNNILEYCLKNNIHFVNSINETSIHFVIKYNNTNIINKYIDVCDNLKIIVDHRDLIWYILTYSDNIYTIKYMFNAFEKNNIKCYPHPLFINNLYNGNPNKLLYVYNKLYKLYDFNTIVDINVGNILYFILQNNHHRFFDFFLNKYIENNVNIPTNIIHKAINTSCNKSTIFKLLKYYKEHNLSDYIYISNITGLCNYGYDIFSYVVKNYEKVTINITKLSSFFEKTINNEFLKFTIDVVKNDIENITINDISIILKYLYKYNIDVINYVFDIFIVPVMKNIHKENPRKFNNDIQFKNFFQRIIDTGNKHKIINICEKYIEYDIEISN